MGAPLEPKPEPEASAEPSVVHPAAGRARRRILIIEDNVDAAETLRDYLELCGYEVQLAFSGPEGLEAAARFLPDVVVCDIGLPGMNGWELAQLIRSTPATAASRLIAITGYGTEEDRRRSSEAGFEAHLTKPLDIDALEALLDRDA
jgi:CheY-like chemotaxis protein